MVKKNRIVTLVLAAVVLAVITSGNALASTFYYDYALSSYIDSSDTIAINTQYQPAGNPDVTYNDYVSWANSFFNYKSVTEVAAVTGYTSPSGGGSITTNGQTTLNAGQYATDVVASEQVTTYPSTTYTIYAQHRYYDGTYRYSSYTSGDMKFH